MTFRVGPFDYTAVIVAERPTDDDDQICDGICDLGRHRIEIFAQVRGQRRLWLLLHELRHAWRYAMPFDLADVEHDADHTAAFAMSAIQDLHAQGGMDALDALAPADRPALALCH